MVLPGYAARCSTTSIRSIGRVLGRNLSLSLQPSLSLVTRSQLDHLRSSARGSRRTAPSARSRASPSSSPSSRSTTRSKRRSRTGRSRGLWRPSPPRRPSPRRRRRPTSTTTISTTSEPAHSHLHLLSCPERSRRGARADESNAGPPAWWNLHSISPRTVNTPGTAAAAAAQLSSSSQQLSNSSRP